MEEIYLTVKEVAELKGCTERYIRKKVLEGSINAESIKVMKQGSGRGGMQYRIPLSGLDKKLQSRFKRRLMAERKAENKFPQPEIKTDVNYEQLSEEERKEITKWKKIISDWQSFRNGRNNKADADVDYSQ